MDLGLDPDTWGTPFVRNTDCLPDEGQAILLWSLVLSRMVEIFSGSLAWFNLFTLCGSWYKHSLLHLVSVTTEMLVKM